ncbi:hypothetical protein [Endozoicomonas euniceicola]|uniref:Uncharacterized protein n=1 Tax=Endozoicomonas euniceicola TaxID=1234143 RepID=A0ABY6GYB6_9GAMM|nr:hypothetical protein [Endozoicomonas euniceicola]UYM17772.1 hypothetical protein NX720_07645 [Endozoicomonas euniceicola]
MKRYHVSAFPLLLLLANPVLSSPVLDSASGYHQEGLLIGQLGKVEESGLLIKGVNINFLLGGGFSQDRLYPTKPFALSVNSKHNPAYQKLISTPFNKQIIVRYLSSPPFAHPLFWLYYGASALVTDVSSLADFKESASFHAFQCVYKDEQNLEFSNYGNSVRSGKFVRVFRWGTFGSKVCTADLHEGGEKVETKQVAHKKYDGTDEKGNAKYRMEYSTVSEKKPNINHLNIYTEEGCKFAEDVLRANKDVRVKVSTKYFAFFNWYPDTIHAIDVNCAD